MYYALNADLYKGGQGGHGNFKGDPYRGPSDRGTDLGEGQASPGQGFGPNVNGLPGTGPEQGFGQDRPNVDGTPGIGQESPEQGFGFGPNVDGPSDIPEQPFNGQPQGDDFGGVNVPDPQEKPLIRGLETPLEPGYGQNVPEQGPRFGGQDNPQRGQEGPDQRPGLTGQDIPQVGPDFRGLDIPQQGPRFGPGDSEQGPGYAANPQQGIGYGPRGPAIPESNIGQGNNGGSDIQGGQGTDYGPTRGDWGQDNGGKQNWGGQDKRGSTDGNWRGGGTSGNGVKGGWESPDGSARGRKARSWGTHGLDKRWGSESENWISLEEAAEPDLKNEPDSEDDGNGRRYVGLFEDEPRAEDWESERRTNPGGRIEEVHWKSNEDGNDIWSSASQNEENNNDIPSLRKWRAEPRIDVGVENIAKDKEDARSDSWLSSEKENGDIPKLRKWRTVDGPQKEIEFKNILKDDDDGASGVWVSSESESSDAVPKSRAWRTVEENPKEFEKSNNKNWWLDSLGGEEHKPKTRFARDAPHLFGGWRTLNNQFGHLNKTPYRRIWNR